jgi:hypothetical protein
MLNDIELAAVLTYVRQSFGNDGEPVTAEAVRKVRDATKGRVNFYTTEEILKEHPIKKEGGDLPGQGVIKPEAVK